MIAYKLFRIKGGKLYPLYVNADKETPIGEWIEAECGELQDNGKVKAKLGNGLCYRPGWHVTTLPFADHIGKRMPDGTLRMRKDTVWCEVEYDDRVSYQEEANQNGTNKNGVVVPVKAYLKRIPKGGFYFYQTNAKAKVPWIITGAIKVNRILSNEEVEDICIKGGIAPQKIA